MSVDTEIKLSLQDFERRASQILEKTCLDYYQSGAGEQFTLNLNNEAFKRLRVRPRCLRNATQIDLSCKILDMQLKWPVGIAPTAMQKMAHSDGESGNAKAAGQFGSVYILSTLSTTSIEEIAELAPYTIKWLQLYIYKNRSLTEQLVHRAEKSNFKAIVLTVDAPIFGQRWSDIRNNFSLPNHLHLANFQIKTDLSNGIYGKKGTSGLGEYATNQFDASLSWKDVKWLITCTHLPVIVKGILTAEDAILARNIGCAGIIVSNHGARQLDYVPASIETLPEIVKAVGEDIVVMLDGGIRCGSDIFKSLALGAKMVFIGRPALWGLACNGQAGVEEMLNILKKDFYITMALTGCQTLNDITNRMVTHESEYAKL